MTQDDSLEDALKSVKELINTPQKKSLEEEVLELTEDDLLDEEDEDHLDYNPRIVNQKLTLKNHNDIALEQIIAEAVKPLLKEWVEQMVADAVTKELNKNK
jgi:hypothetical protein